MSLGKKKILSQAAAAAAGASGYFNIATYQTEGAAYSHTGLGFKPDLLWIKRRNGTSDHYWFDSTRGVGKAVLLNTNVYAEITNAQYQTAFGDDGFTIGTNSTLSGSGNTYVAWCFKANGGTTSTNSDGTINTTIQTNSDFGATSPFSILKYQGNGTFNATIGHGLGQQVKFAIFKNLDSGTYNYVYYDGLSGSNYNLYMNTADQEQADGVLQGGGTSTLTLGTSTAVNGNGTNYLCYAWANISGVQKFGTYGGNSSTSNTIYTTDNGTSGGANGFQPSMVVIKNIGGGDNWYILDDQRVNSALPAVNVLYPNLTNAEADNIGGNGEYSMNFLSNGFELKEITAGYNQTGQNYFYWAIA